MEPSKRNVRGGHAEGRRRLPAEGGPRRAISPCCLFRGGMAVRRGCGSLRAGFGPASGVHNHGLLFKGKTLLLPCPLYARDGLRSSCKAAVIFPMACQGGGSVDGQYAVVLRAVLCGMRRLQKMPDRPPPGTARDRWRAMPRLSSLRLIARNPSGPGACLYLGLPLNLLAGPGGSG